MAQWVSRYYILILFSSLSHTLFCQSVGDSLFSGGQRAFKQQNFAQAYQNFEQAAAYFSNHNEYERYVKSLLQMARMTQFTRAVSMSAIPEILQPIEELLKENKIERHHVSTAAYYTTLGFYHERVSGNLEEALSLFTDGLSICDEVGHPADTQRLMMLIEISRVYITKGQLDRAMIHAETAFDLSLKLLGKTHPSSANVFYHLGHVYYRSGRYDQARALVLEGIEIMQDIKAPPFQIGLGYQNLFTTDVAQLDLKSARENARRAIEIQHQYFGSGHESTGTIYRDLGTMHLFLDQADSAIHYLSKAMNIYLDRFGPTYPNLHLIYINLGIAYTANHQFDTAISFHLKGLKIHTTVAEELDSYINLSHCYIESGQFAKAKEYLVMAEKLTIDSSIDKIIIVSRLHHTKGQYFYQQDSFLQAAKSWHTSLYKLNRISDQVSHFKYPPVDSFLNLVFGAEQVVFQSEALFSYYLTTKNLSDLELALQAMQYADKTMDKLRATYRNAESKIFLQKKARNHYENLLDAAMAGWTETGDQHYLSYAWQAMEKSRSLLLMETMKSANVDDFGLPKDLTQKHRNLQDDLAGLEERLLEASRQQDHVLQGDLQLKYFSTWDSLIRVQNEIKINYPKYFELTSNLTPASPSEIQSILKAEECLMQFFWGEDHVYRLIVTPDTLYFDRLAETDSVQDILDKWVIQMQSLEFILEYPEASTDSITTLSKTLFDELLADRYGGLQNFTKLIIVPDQKLGYLSFEALCKKSNPQDDPQYLLQDHAIKYAFSATHYLSSDFDHSDLVSGKIAGFAPSYQAFNLDDAQQDVALQRLYRTGNLSLPGAIDEVNSIHSMLGGDKYLDQEATEYNFKRRVGDYDLIHLALHGMINDQDPMLSRLIFDSHDSIEDSYLHAYEIYNLPLQANLVVLSACNTGLGRIEKGEGIMSLSRAFAYAGTPQLVASLWKADDQATGKIMTSFYRQLANKESLETGLREAKLEYLKNQKVDLLKHPYFWSGFVYYTQCNQATSDSKPVIWSIALVLLILLCFWGYQRIG